MPTYEYACKKCREHLEVVQSFRDDPLTTCPNCGGELRKVFGAIGVTFKGSGFYKTDSRPRPKEGGESKSGASAGSKTSESQSSDSKGSESKASESKSSESKSSESKSSESKGSESKSGASKSGSGSSEPKPGSSGSRAAAS